MYILPQNTSEAKVPLWKSSF